MPKIVSIATYQTPYHVEQQQVLLLAKKLFEQSYEDIDRLLTVFHNGQIEKRSFCMPLQWFEEQHSFEERNDLYINLAVQYGAEAIRACLQHENFLKQGMSVEEIDAIFYISSSGIATPTIDARIMNVLPFSPHTKRIPLWGLGCAGGAAGLSRAFDYCLAYPEAKVLVLCVELCSLTFLHNDFSKSNLVGSSLFSDGVACALVTGDQVYQDIQKQDTFLAPTIRATHSTLLPDSEDVMGWNVKNDGLQVVFSRDIPQIIKGWLEPNLKQFLVKYQLDIDEITHFIAHPGGKKVLEAYVDALGFAPEQLKHSQQVLSRYGNMSSATVLYVLMEYLLQEDIQQGDLGIITALGPGFSSELLLLEWGLG